MKRIVLIIFGLIIMIGSLIGGTALAWYLENGMLGFVSGGGCIIGFIILMKAIYSKVD